MTTNGFSIKPLKLKLLAGEQKATQRCFLPFFCWVLRLTPCESRPVVFLLGSAFPWVICGESDHFWRGTPAYEQTGVD